MTPAWQPDHGAGTWHPSGHRLGPVRFEQRVGRFARGRSISVDVAAPWSARCRVTIWTDAIPGMRPGDERSLTEDGHTFRITAIGELGCDTGRRRYEGSADDLVHGVSA